METTRRTGQALPLRQGLEDPGRIRTRDLPLSQRDALSAELQARYHNGGDETRFQGTPCGFDLRPDEARQARRSIPYDAAATLYASSGSKVRIWSISSRSLLFDADASRNLP